MIFVVSDGKVAEQGHPHNLLKIEGGYFDGMVKSTGEQSNERLRKEAEKAIMESKFIL